MCGGIKSHGGRRTQRAPERAADACNTFSRLSEFGHRGQRYVRNCGSMSGTGQTGAKRMGSFALGGRRLPERTKGLIAEIRRRHRDVKVAAPTDSSRSDAIDAAERRRSELKAQLAEDPGWI